MTFNSKIMPNEALDPNSLVGSMLHRPEAADGVETACGSQRLDESPEIRAIPRPCVPFSVIRPGGDLASATLCELMAHAYINFDGDAVESMAEVLEVVRDWLFPDGDEQGSAFAKDAAWGERQRIRDHLTTQSQLHAIKP